MNIVGIEGMTSGRLSQELSMGGRFVVFQYCVSIIVLTFKRPSPVYFIRSGENPTVKGLVWSLITLLFGWWGIPWGPIYSIQTLALNFKGGRDVTAQVAASLRTLPGA